MIETKRPSTKGSAGNSPTHGFIRRLRRRRLFPLLVVLQIALGLLVAFGSLRLVLAAATLITLYVVTLVWHPSPLLLVGLLLPIYSVGHINPTVFDLATIGLLGAITLLQVLKGTWRANYSVPMLVFIAALVLTTVVHHAPTSLAQGVGFVAALAVAWWLSSSRDAVVSLASGYVIGVAASVSVATLAALHIADLAPIHTYRGFSGLSSTRSLLGFQAALAFTILFFGARKWRGVVRWSVLTLLGIGMLLSGGRGGAVAFAVTIIIMAGLTADTRLWRGILIGTVVLVALVTVIPFPTVSRLLAHDPRLRTSFNAYSTNRLGIYSATLHEGVRKPLGAGFGQGVDVSSTTSCVPTPTNPCLASAHDEILQELLVGGWPLALAATMLLVSASIVAVVLCRKRTMEGRLFCSVLILSISWGAVSSGPLGTKRAMILFVTFYLVSIRIMNQDRAPHHELPPSTPLLV